MKEVYDILESIGARLAVTVLSPDTEKSLFKKKRCLWLLKLAEEALISDEEVPPNTL